MKTRTQDQDFLAIKYTKNQDYGLFIKTLKKRVDNYFTGRGISKYANAWYYFKLSLIFFVFFSSYGLMISNKFSPGIVFLLATVFGISSVLMVMNISHDAAHNALSANNRVNRFFTWTFELNGLSHYLWKINHNIIHHPYPNVAPIDSEITIAIPFIRFTTYFKKLKIQRYQHFYSPILYMFFTLNLLLGRDFTDAKIFPKKTSQQVVKHFPARFYLLFFFTKIFYFGYALVIPMLVLDIVWWKVLIGFLWVHAIMSIFELSIQTPLHVNEYSPVIEVGEKGKINTNWALQMLMSTTDYLPQSKLANIITGGINTHTIHHFYPGICHIHYVALTKILEDTSLEFSMPYQCRPWLEGMKSHFRRLKELALSA